MKNIENNLSKEELVYYRVERWCREEISNGSNFLFDPVLFREAIEAESKREDFPLESLLSLFRNVYIKHIKINSNRIKSILHTKIIKEYLLGRSINDLAKECNFSAALLARRVVEEVTDLGKKKLSTVMKDPLKELGSIDVIKPKYQGAEKHLRDKWLVGGPPTRSMETTRLALEVKEAIASDSLCGPASDRARHFIGIEYEIVLERNLRKIGIPFESEAQLREKGSARTPDVVLSCPICVQVNEKYRFVGWIDSKALYGDIDTHRTILSQARSYVHRFGPGMILYWFGHGPLSKLEDADGDLVIVGWKFPETVLWPTGEIGPRKSLDLHTVRNEKLSNQTSPKAIEAKEP